MADRPVQAVPDEDELDVFDLDTLENEATKAPFTFAVDGEKFSMSSPEEADWQVSTGFSEDDPQGIRRLIIEVLGDEQFKRFAQHRVPGWKMGKLLEACFAHYGADPGKSQGSGRSSKRTKKK